MHKSKQFLVIILYLHMYQLWHTYIWLGSFSYLVKNELVAGCNKNVLVYIFNESFYFSIDFEKSKTTSGYSKRYNDAKIFLIHQSWWPTNVRGNWISTSNSENMFHWFHLVLNTFQDVSWNFYLLEFEIYIKLIIIFWHR